MCGQDKKLGERLQITHIAMKNSNLLLMKILMHFMKLLTAGCYASMVRSTSRIVTVLGADALGS